MLTVQQGDSTSLLVDKNIPRNNNPIASTLANQIMSEKQNKTTSNWQSILSSPRSLFAFDNSSSSSSSSSSNAPVVNNNSKEITVSYWDFAGQEIYYVLNETFIQKHNLYLVVFNLEHFAVIFDSSYRKEKGIKESTLVQEERKEKTVNNILLWLNNIHSHSRTTTKSTTTTKAKAKAKANIILIGTHADSLKVENAERILKKTNDLLKERLQEGNPILDQILVGKNETREDRLYFAVSCKKRHGLAFSDLPELIHLLEAKTMEAVQDESNPSIPIRWLYYLKELQKSQFVSDHCLTYEKAYEIINEAHQKLTFHQQSTNIKGGKSLHNNQILSHHTFEIILKYFHNMGEIIYFGKVNKSTTRDRNNKEIDNEMQHNRFDEQQTQQTQQTLVVVNPIWVAETFQKLIWREDLKKIEAKHFDSCVTNT